MSGSTWLVLLPLAAILLSVLLHPSFSPIDPVPCHLPHPPPLEGSFSPNERLLTARRLFQGQVQGPEDVLADEEGNLYSSNEDGTIRKMWANGSVSVWARTGGRPLGMEWVLKGECMLVCDSPKGLLRACSDGRVETLSTQADGRQFRFTNNVDVGADGTIYFSDSSDTHDYDHKKHEMLEGRGHGRLLRLHPGNSSTEALLDNIVFANGVALSREEDFVLVAETIWARILRFYLRGPKAGTSDVFMENLPGYPDNINRNGDLFWVALFKRDASIETMLTKSWLKSILARVPEWMQPKLPAGAMAMAVDHEGRVAHFFTDLKGKEVSSLTSVRQVGGSLLLGFLDSDFVATVDLPTED